MSFASFIKSPPQEIVKYPATILRQVANPIEQFDDLRHVTEIMFGLMYKWHGVGLAAPQVGLPYRLFVVNAGDKERVFVNPEVISYGSRLSKAEEGCLSLPGIYADIVRPHRFIFRAQTLEGKTEKYAFEGMMGRIASHENNHLDGVLIIDKMSPEDRKRISPILTQLEAK